ncbi:hypothetical protein TNCV_789871 [Trichonephila clavipes]|nr:hypothetical protein TNCV_789871 [Trichonephila clavipes]
MCVGKEKEIYRLPSSELRENLFISYFPHFLFQEDGQIEDAATLSGMLMGQEGEISSPSSFSLDECGADGGFSSAVIQRWNSKQSSSRKSSHEVGERGGNVGGRCPLKLFSLNLTQSLDPTQSRSGGIRNNNDEKNPKAENQPSRAGTDEPKGTLSDKSHNSSAKEVAVYLGYSGRRIYIRKVRTLVRKELSYKVRFSGH